MIRSSTYFLRGLGITAVEAETLISSINKYYGQFEKKKIGKNGTPRRNPDGTVATRTINQSFNKLKRIQAKIKILLDRIEFPRCAMGGLQGKSNIINAAAHLGKKYKFTTDLKDFYPSVDYKRVYQSLISSGFSENVARYITRFTTYKGCLPQGTPTSTHLSNLVFLQTDRALQSFCSEKGITYTRYVDDLCFSSQTCFKEFTPQLIRIIHLNRFRINQQKTFYSTFQEITGIYVTNNRLMVPRRITEKLESFRNQPESIKAFVSLTQYCYRINTFKRGWKAANAKNLESGPSDSIAPILHNPLLKVSSIVID